MQDTRTTDYYTLLELLPSATEAEMKKAWHEQLQVWHPDRFNHSPTLHRKAETRTQLINQAYQTLSDPDKRRKYDVAYKKNYQRRLYYFKIKHLNVAVTLALLLFTGLFGWYVIRMIDGDRSKKVIKVVNDVKAPVSPPKTPVHHKKRHSDKPTSVTDQKLVLPKDTVINNAIKPATINDDKPIIEQDDRDKPGSISYLQSNVTGVIYLHESANYTSPIVSKVPNHSKVTILEKGDQFYKVTFNDQTGYVPKWTVVKQ